MNPLRLLVLLSLVGCADRSTAVSSPSPNSFDLYRAQTLQHLERDRRFQSPDHTLELAWNAPREWLAPAPNGHGVLLVHGLGDSPGSFTDIGAQLASQGYRVRTLLLPGHGTQPADMLGVNIEDWRRTVAQQVALLRQDVDQVYLGGFSTGANLVLEYAMDEPDIRGLLLFSPAFKARNRFIWLLPWLAPVKPWLRDPAGPRQQQTALRYQNVPTNGFVQFYQTSERVRDKLTTATFDRPVLIVSAAHDSVVDVQFVKATFAERFTHPASRMIWYGDLPAAQQSPRVLVRSDHLPAERISQFSHMGVLFAPDNPLYGRRGSQPVCLNGQTDEDFARCKAGEPLWYSAWGYREPGKVHARLTFNPYFDWQAQIMDQVMQAACSEC
ncbi:alpha/beta fold hydrolase [Pseudomonas kairouanensis]|uniref:Alpha/beta fold hydrolase n=1 Tax=Pseudomonas kairouanensis TaxID=2293832 RepID=A0A4Z0ART3_9PSED|nr:alpha/beta fold hydrolase [Pseudomonas kairouanensis]TFY89107.1 alpha/beta fold hydrolase [Pseudomonas kairouanensis]